MREFGVSRARFRIGDDRRNEDRDRCEEQQARLQPRAVAVEFLRVVLQPAEQERYAQHEQGIGDDCAGDRGLHQDVLPGAQGGECDQKLGQVAQGRIEQSADCITRSRCHLFGGAAQQRRQWHDRQHRQDEMERVRLRRKLVRGDRDRHQDEQPQQWRVANVVEQRHAVPPG